MTKTLEEIAKQLRDANKKIQLIYAFNGTGKTRLSRAMKDLIAPKVEGDGEPARNKFLYYSAFTEDLFYWDNDLTGDAEPKLIIQPNDFTDWILRDRGLDQGIVDHFQRYADEKLTPSFLVETRQIVKSDGSRENQDFFPAVTFAYDRGTERTTGVKLSKGEESNFIWSIFFTLLEEVISTLNVVEVAERSTYQFNTLEYVFIDDPVSSLDENHLIELAVNLAELIKHPPPQLKFVITTHSPLFYNVLHNELDLKKAPANQGCYLLERHADGSFTLNTKLGDANKSFSYHLHLRRILEEAIAQDKVERYHFTLLRNLYEKTASFLGHEKWGDLLNTAEGSKDAYVRVINTFSHSSLSTEQMADPTPQEKRTVKFLLDNLINNYGYWKQDALNG